MNRLVIDASIAIKWLITEKGSREAVRLRRSNQAMAPDLLVAECANIIWKKVQRAELSREQALLAARVLQAADIELRPMRTLTEQAVEIAVALAHPVYDCLYLALAAEQGGPFVTADARLLTRVGRASGGRYRDLVIDLATADRDRPR